MMVVIKVLQYKIIQENHDVSAVEHVGFNKIVNQIERGLRWRGMWCCEPWLAFNGF